MRNIPISDFTGPRTMRYSADGSRTMTPRPSIRARQMVERLEAIFAGQDDWQGDWTPAFREYLAREFQLDKGGAMVMWRHEDPAAPAAPEAPGAPHREIRRIIINSADGKANHEAMAMAMANGAMPHGGAIVCSDKDGAATVVTNDAGGDGKARMVKVKICAMAHAEKSALEGLKSARERLASDPKLPANVRDDVLKSLDEEIAKLSKAG